LDIERRSGLYILGRPRTGKTTLIKQIIYQDMKHNHGVFFLDPHGDAIDDLLKHIPIHRKQDVIVLDPTHETDAFGINLLKCEDKTSRSQRRDAYTKTYTVFKKLFADEKGAWGPWMQQALQFTLYAFIENPGYTLAEVPLFLDPKQEELREEIVGNTTENWEAANFWRTEISLPEREQRDRGSALLTRVNTLLGQPDVRDIIGQNKTTLDFSKIIEQRKILFVKISANLPSDIKAFIGTIIISELIHAVRNRYKIPERERHQFCIFVDEVQHFVGVEDFDVLFTEAGKYGIATTIAHQERYGQLGDNEAILGATDAAGNKVFFRLSVEDATEKAAEFSEKPPTKTDRERLLTISQKPVEDILNGHANPQVMAFASEYLRSLTNRFEDAKEAMEGERIKRQALVDAATSARDDAQYERADYRSLSQRSNIQSAIGRAEQLMKAAQERNNNLLTLFESTQELRQVMRSLDSFLTAIMEGSLAKGQEAYVRSLLEIVAVFYPIPEPLALYAALEYGDSSTSRSIPFAFARAIRLLSSEATAIEKRLVQEHADQTGREDAAFHTQQQEKFRRGFAAYLSVKDKIKQGRVDSVRQELSQWKFDFSGFPVHS